MKPRRRVLYLTAAFPGRVDPGRAVFVANLARELGKTMELVVLAPQIHRRDPSREWWGGIRVQRFPFVSEGRLLKEYRSLPGVAAASYLVSGVRQAVLLACRWRPDVILTHWVLPAGPIGLVASRLSSVPLVLNAHGSDLNVYAGKGPVLRRLAAGTLSSAALTIAASRPIRDRIVGEFGIPPERVEVIPSGVDPAFLEGPSRGTAREQIRIPSRARLLLYVGDLTEAKGIPVAAQAIREIQEKDESVWACFVGRGPVSRTLAGLPRVLLPGPLPNRELPPYYRAADLFVFPSLSEGTPVSVMEALAAGLPVVASRVGGVPALVRDGETGCLVPPGDPSRLAEGIRSLLADEAGRASMRRAAAEEGKRHLAGPRARSVAGILERVIRDGGEEPGARYDRFWRTTRPDRRDARSRERARAASRLLDLGRNGSSRGKLLDVGCGRGAVAASMKEVGFDVRGIDISAEAVRETRLLGVPAEVIDVEREPLPGRFDVITCLEVLEHLRSPEAALHRMARALRSGGRIVVSLPESPPVLRLALTEAEGHHHRFSRTRALRLFGRAGLVVIGEETISIAPPRWGAVKRVLDAVAAIAPSALAISRVYALAPSAERPPGTEQP